MTNQVISGRPEFGNMDHIKAIRKLETIRDIHSNPSWVAGQVLAAHRKEDGE